MDSRQPRVRQGGAPRRRWLGASLAALGVLLLAGCGKVDLKDWAKAGTDRRAGVSATEVQGEDESAVDRGPAGLAGKTAAEVRSVLGQPQGRLRTQSGVVWLYPQWRIELNAEGWVTSVEQEAPAQVESGTVAAVESVTVISEGGRAVDLAALLPAGKVAIVDFYADWCGPCRKISPHLEQLARSDPEVVLIKVDIVKWDTEVARQYRIRSVPNIRVYNGRQQAVGSPSSDLNAVRLYVDQAKRS